MTATNLGNVRGATGAKGDKGDKGDQGIQGVQGVGVPSGGSVGNLLVNSAPGVGTWSADNKVVGTTGSTDKALVRWDGITGKSVQNSAVVINDVTTVTKQTLNPSPVSISATQFIDARGTKPGLFLSSYSSDSDANPGVNGTMSAYIAPWGKASSIAANMSYGYNGDSFANNAFTVESGASDTTAGLLRYNANAGAGGTSGTWELAASEKSTGIGTLVTLFKLFTAKLGLIQINATKTLNRGITLTDTGVGIETNVPTAAFDVNGTSRFRNTATFNDQIIDNVGSSGLDGQVLKKVGGLVLWSNP